MAVSNGLVASAHVSAKENSKVMHARCPSVPSTTSARSVAAIEAR